VLFPAGYPRLELITPETSCASLVRRIQERRVETQGHALRLIYRGRILGGQEDLRNILHNTTDIILHCSVGNDLSSAAAVEETGDIDGLLSPSASNREHLTGFDRLRAAGLSETEIQDLREDFSRVHGRTDEVEVRQMEEQWMDEDANESLGEPPGVYREILVGTLIGFYGGLLGLLFLREPQLMSKRTQLAVIAGLLINVCFSVIRV